MVETSENDNKIDTFAIRIPTWFWNEALWHNQRYVCIEISLSPSHHRHYCYRRVFRPRFSTSHPAHRVSAFTRTGTTETGRPWPRSHDFPQTGNRDRMFFSSDFDASSQSCRGTRELSTRGEKTAQ